MSLKRIGMKGVLFALFATNGAMVLPVLATNSAAALPTGKANVDYVDVFIGTAGDRGQLDPSASVPYGMVKVGPDCIPASHVGYDFGTTLISGFSVNRLSGVGCRGAGGNLSIRPASPRSELHIVKESEHAAPGYYSTRLDNGVKVELTANNNVAVERFTFGDDGRKREFYIDLLKSFAPLEGFEYNVVSDREITGWISAQNTCKMGRYKFYFYLHTDREFVLKDRPDNSIALEFDASVPMVEFRVALSPVSISDAEVRFRESEDRTFAQLRSNASELWSRKLDVIDVEGDEADKKMFYTSLYRCFLTPVDVTAADGSFLNSQGNREEGDGMPYYTSWSLWDTYRTKFPLLTIIDPQQMSGFCRSLCKLYQTGKADWSTMYECAPTTRTEHAAIILLDACNKGIGGFDLGAVYDKIVADVENLRLHSPDSYLEAAYDFWALSRIARQLGREDDYRRFDRKATDTWQGVWKEKFRVIDPERFDIVHGEGLYEGTLWQYRWAVPFDIEGLSNLIGSKKQTKDELEYFFKNNLYNHGNQPDIHAAYIFNRLGYPELAQYWVNRIIAHPMVHRYGTHEHFPQPYVGKAYTPQPQGFIPEMDDDDGTMSAWYVLSALGIYPLVPGEPVYELVSPIFRAASIRLPDGNRFRIECKRESPDACILKKAVLNGKRMKNFRLKHEDINRGGVLTLYY